MNAVLLVDQDVVIKIWLNWANQSREEILGLLDILDNLCSYSLHSRNWLILVVILHCSQFKNNHNHNHNHNHKEPLTQRDRLWATAKSFIFMAVCSTKFITLLEGTVLIVFWTPLLKAVFPHLPHSLKYYSIISNPQQYILQEHLQIS